MLAVYQALYLKMGKAYFRGAGAGAGAGAGRNRGLYKKLMPVKQFVVPGICGILNGGSRVVEVFVNRRADQAF